MAGTDNNVIFGSEFDGEGVAKGVDALVAKLEQAKASERELKEEVAGFNKELKNNQTELDKTNKLLAYTLQPAHAEEYKKKIDALNESNQKLITSISTTNTKIDAQNKVVKDLNKTLNETEANHARVGKALSRFTDLNHLAAEGVGLFRRRVVDMGYSLVAGFVGGLISQVIPALIEYISELGNTNDAVEEARKQQEALNEIKDQAVKGYSAEVSKLEIYKAKLDDITIPQAERIRLAKEYNKTAEEGNKIDTTQIDNIDLLNQAIDRQIEKIKERAIAKAFENIIAEKAQTLFEAQLQLEEKAPAIDTKTLDIIKKNVSNLVTATASALNIDVLKSRVNPEELLSLADLPEDQLKKLAEHGDQYKILLDKRTRDQLLFFKQQINDINNFRHGMQDAPNEIIRIQDKIFKAQQDFDRTMKAGLGIVSVDDLLPFTKGTEDKTIENVFAQKLRELQARLAEVTAKSFESEGTIRKQFAASLAKEIASINDLTKGDKPKLTPGQAGILNNLLGKINDAQLEKSLDDFRKKILDAKKKIDDAIQAAENEAAIKRIDNIRDEFEKEKQLIDERVGQAIEGLIKKRDDLVSQIDKSSLSSADKKRKKLVVFGIFSDLIDETEIAGTKAQIDNSFKQFNAAVKDGNILFEKLQLQNSEATASDIQEAKKLYEEGAINYEEYQKRITKAIKDGKTERDKIRLLELNSDLNAINERLKTETDLTNRKNLEQQQISLRSQIAEINSSINNKEDDPAKKRAEEIQKYTQALSSLLSTIVSFWQQVNATEAAALDRSIALQQTRVDNARIIADKGNAEYLEMEQKRLDELQRKREENARKQLVINQALVLSNALLAAVSAIAQAAASTGAAAPFAAIAAGIAVIGAIAAAFSFVNSLQTPVATFYEGTEYVDGARRPLGKDTVPARLHIGERVVTAQENKDYFNSLSAIHNRRVPPEILNSFVDAYEVGNIPAVDFGRLSEATNNKLGFDSLEVLNKFEKLNDTMEGVVDAVAQIGIKVNMDENGLSAAIETANKRRKIKKRS